MKELYSRTRLCPYKMMGTVCDLSMEHGMYSKIQILRDNLDDFILEINVQSILNCYRHR